MTERRPWRYRCPTCGSVQVTRYSGARMPSRNELVGRKLHHSGNLRTGIMAIPKYHCDNCHAKFDTPKDMLILSGSIPDGRKQQDPAEATIHSRAKAAELFSNNTHVTTPPNFCGHSNDSGKFPRTAGGLVLFRAPTSHGLGPNTLGQVHSQSSSCPHSCSKLNIFPNTADCRMRSIPQGSFQLSRLSSARSEQLHEGAQQVEGSTPSGGLWFCQFPGSKTDTRGEQTIATRLSHLGRWENN